MIQHQKEQGSLGQKSTNLRQKSRSRRIRKPTAPKKQVNKIPKPQKRPPKSPFKALLGTKPNRRPTPNRARIDAASKRGACVHFSMSRRHGSKSRGLQATSASPGRAASGRNGKHRIKETGKQARKQRKEKRESKPKHQLAN